MRVHLLAALCRTWFWKVTRRLEPNPHVLKGPPTYSQGCGRMKSSSHSEG